MTPASLTFSTTAVVDLFCGVGGLTKGLANAGLHVVAGIDLDPDCRFPYTTNNDAEFHLADVSTLDPESVASRFPQNSLRIISGCAPCQPFSRYGRAAENRRSEWSLLDDFGQLAVAVRPDVITMENVPEVCHHSVFTKFVDCLKRTGYSVAYANLYCPDYGVAQNRRRLVLLASLHGEIDIPKPTRRPENYKTVRSVIGSLPQLAAGETNESDKLHRACKLSETNLQRLRASTPGGTWRDWPEALRASCHQAESGATYPAVYGRMQWDAVAPTITTQFFGFGNGRFGHPEQDRAISIREGALLQSFPKHYRFHPTDTKMSVQRLGRLIGNAVPVKLGEAIGRAIKKHVKQKVETRGTN
jgi:DNA (cytosine-5)-methyltransferase 1